jgi:hypothetical protein
MIFNDAIVVSDRQFPTVLEAASKTTALDVIPAVLVQPRIQRPTCWNDQHHDMERQ